MDGYVLLLTLGEFKRCPFKEGVPPVDGQLDEDIVELQVDPLEFWLPLYAVVHETTNHQAVCVVLGLTCVVRVVLGTLTLGYARSALSLLGFLLSPFLLLLPLLVGLTGVHYSGNVRGAEFRDAEEAGLAFLFTDQSLELVYSLPVHMLHAQEAQRLLLATPRTFPLFDTVSVEGHRVIVVILYCLVESLE